MPSPIQNQTLISLPPKIEDFEQVKLFLSKLIEKLDVVLGYRGNSQYLTNNDLSTLNVGKLRSDIDSAVAQLSDLKTKLSGSTSVPDLNSAVVTVGAAYNQGQVQSVANQVIVVSNKLDDLLAVIRTVGLIS